MRKIRGSPRGKTVVGGRARGALVYSRKVLAGARLSPEGWGEGWREAG